MARKCPECTSTGEKQHSDSYKNENLAEEPGRKQKCVLEDIDRIFRQSANVDASLSTAETNLEDFNGTGQKACDGSCELKTRHQKLLRANKLPIESFDANHS